MTQRTVLACAAVSAVAARARAARGGVAEDAIMLSISGIAAGLKKNTG